MFRISIFFFVVLSLLSCKSSEKFSGFSYDPPGATNTIDKLIQAQKIRVIGAGTPKVWVSNEYATARMNDFYALNDSTYEVYIKPENAPINNSPWYGFKIWSDSLQTITVQLNYDDARHRYAPKTIFEANLTDETAIDSLYSYPLETHIDTTSGKATIKLRVGTIPLIVSAQYPFSSAFLDQVLQSPQILENSTTRVIGYSHQERPIYEIEVNQTLANTKKGVLIILSRQHPPEISGFLSSLFFLESLLDDSELAREFRSHFIIKAYPMINPDGVDNGHWRHNATGIDLNRDWEFFNQPETRAVRDALLPIKRDSLQKVYYGIDFHSTNENIFYPIEQSVKTFPDNLTQRLYPLIVENNPEILFNYEEFDTNSPISKNWLYKTFGSDALTFEMDDELSSFDIDSVSKSLARHVMRLLLDEYINNN